MPFTDPTEHPRPLLRRPWTSLSGEWDLVVRNAINGSPHLVGTVRPA